MHIKKKEIRAKDSFHWSMTFSKKKKIQKKTIQIKCRIKFIWRKSNKLYNWNVIQLIYKEKQKKNNFFFL